MAKRRKRLANRILLLLLLLVVIDRLLREGHDAAVKDSPVDFFDLLGRADLTSWAPPDKSTRWSNLSQIDDRYRRLRSLPSGKEGSVAVYLDLASGDDVQVVVKTISTPARNQIPPELLPHFDTLTSSWPSEIPATLAFGARTIKGQSPVVPVYDYFMLKDISASPDRWCWVLVTELVDGGTLADLAGRLSQSLNTTDQIDVAYRSAFEKLLSGLHFLHDQGYCHDDVKPANIFVQGPGNWLLGDLGNLRDAKHPWHQTGDWRRRNQLADCRANDIRRAFKSYMVFLRLATQNEAQFDWEFLTGARAWSQMYWCKTRGESCSEGTQKSVTVPKEAFRFSGSTFGNRIRKFIVQEELAWNLPRWRVLLRP